AAAAVDGNAGTAWDGRDDDRLVLDLGSVREFGGMVLQWGEGAHASRYAVQLSMDGKAFHDVRHVAEGNGGTDWIALPESEARYVGVLVQGGPGQARLLREASIEPLAFAATPNDFIRSVAAQSPRGLFPRGFSGEQPYWTVVGVDAGSDQGLIGEDGAVEVSRGGFRVEPFVLAGGDLVTWADVEVSQSLQDDYLPIPGVAWKHPDFGLQVTAFAHGDAGQAQLVARYRLENTSDRPQAYTLALAIRPLQVNPPTQFLSTVGGVSRIDSTSVGPITTEVNGEPRLFARQAPDARFASTFDHGMATSLLASRELPKATRAEDPAGLASGALLYRMELAPGESREVDLLAPLIGDMPFKANDWSAADMQARTAQAWRGQLDDVRIDVPPEVKALADTVRTATAHMLISRIGPSLRPGTRSYARSWIRDGAMISEGLLRMGRTDAV